MKQKRHITGFYIETLLLILVFVSIILVITNIFGMARVSSARARHLTTAVALAQNTAEAAAASRSVDETAALLQENGNTEVSSDGTGLTARYNSDLTPSADGIYRVDLTWTEEEALADCIVSVFYAEEEEPVYSIHTAVYVKEEGVRE